MTTTNYKTINQNTGLEVDLSTIFQPYTTGIKAATTHYEVTGLGDFNNVFQANTGTSINYDTGYKVSGTDLRYIFSPKLPFSITGTNNTDYQITQIIPSTSYYITILTNIPVFTALENMNVTYTLVSGGFAGASYVNQGGTSGGGLYYTAGGGGGGGGQVLNVTTPVILSTSNTLQFQIGSGQTIGQAPSTAQNTAITISITNQTNYTLGGRGGIAGTPNTNMTGSGGTGNAGGAAFNPPGSPPTGWTSKTTSAGGGGGGAGGVGQTGSSFGGGGLPVNIFSGRGAPGTAGVNGIIYGGGGGGGAIENHMTAAGVQVYGVVAAANTGGGGIGGNTSQNINGANGSANTGGGGGGGGGANLSGSAGGSGGSGIVVLSINII